MRRSLVLTDESARHPFLASIPPHVRSGRDPVPARLPWGLTIDDIRSFLVAYCACFMATSAFIA
ncbi:MAG TPA: hypothetical protein VLA37_00085 [Sphingomonadaceae bacterium]|nr:hypothetical protein [Sphingomonadaceae bacterium]